MIRHAFIELRRAVADDFKTKDGKALFGAVYFVQNCDLSIGPKIHYLNDDTNKDEFKGLFNDGRIFVFANPNEVINVDEVTVKEWNEVV